MDIRDPHLGPGKIWKGCDDTNVVYRLSPDGGMQRKPVCADCQARGQRCFEDCKDRGDCLLYGEDAWICGRCQFIDICDEDISADDLAEIDYLRLIKEAQEALDNANVPEEDIYYKIDPEEPSRKRFVPDTESLARFIDQNDSFQIPNPLRGLSTNTPTSLDVSRQDWEELGEEFKGLGIEEAQALLIKRLGSRRWRLDNLYKVTDEKANVLTFKMRFAQKLLFLSMWFCNIVLKSRQHGITTFMCILLLDTCLFNSNMHTAIIAHNKEDAKDFFTKKVKFAYDNLPNWLKAGFKAKQDAVGVLSFDNGSSIRVTTSGRSGTYQMVHVSEFGKMCAKFPAKAQEVITGTLNTIHPGQIVTIESTAEGREGKFYEMTKDAMNAAKEGRQLSELDFKFHFFGANEKAENRVTIPVPIPTRLVCLQGKDAG
jgi:hypothetical protein